MKKQVKLMLKGLSADNGVPFTKEIRTLDEVKDSGNYTVIGRNVSVENGLPAISGKAHNCFCCEAQLTVTCCYPENESQSDTAYGQSLTVCDRETGATNTFTRTITPTKNDGKWSEWQMAAFGDMNLMSQNNDINKAFSSLQTKVDSEILRSESIDERLQTSFENIAETLSYRPLISPVVINGTQNNGANSNAITTNKVPGKVGETYSIITDRPASQGCVYIYGYKTYSSLEGDLASNTNMVRFLDYDKNSTDNSITLQRGEVCFSFVITQLNESTGKKVPVRTTSFDGYYIKIKTSSKIESIETDLKSECLRAVAEESAIRAQLSTLLTPNVTIELGTFSDTTGEPLERTNRCRFRAIPVKSILGVRMRNFPGIKTWVQCLDCNKQLIGTIGTIWSSDSAEIVVKEIEKSTFYLNLVFKRNDNGNITDSDISNITNWVTELFFANDDRVADTFINTLNKSIYTRNIDKVALLAAMCRYRKNNIAPYKDYQMLVCTDSHSDKIALSNSIDALNSFKTIDAWIYCGDLMGDYYAPREVEHLYDCLSRADKPFYLVAGNHDVGNTQYVAACATHNQMYNTFVKPMVDAGCLKLGEYTEGLPYWYHDDETYRVRLIGLYEYDDPMDFDDTYWRPVPYDASKPLIATNTSYATGDIVNAFVWGAGNNYFDYTTYSFECVKACTTSGTFFHSCVQYLPKYKIMRGMRVIRQEQAQWFLDTLANTPTGYGVIIAMHNPFSDDAVSIESKFSQKTDIKGVRFTQNLMQTDFIRNAVAAFINGINYSEEVVMKNEAAYLNTIPRADGSNYAYKVEKDFSSKKNCHFLGFVGGHIHWDFVFKDSTDNFYQIAPCCATTNIVNATNCDIRRTDEDGPAKDSLTVVSFAQDRITLCKIGVNVTEEGKMRDCEVITL